MSTGSSPNQIYIAAVESNKSLFATDPSFQPLLERAWNTLGYDACVEYARAFERIMFLTPIYRDNEDECFIMVVDPATSSSKTPVFKRGPAVCGAVRRSNDGHPQIRCLQHAGFRTPGKMGRCRLHLRKGDHAALVAALPKQGLGLRMRDYIDANLDQAGKDTFGSLDTEIKIAEFLLHSYMQLDMPTDVLPLVNDALDRLGMLKLTRSKINASSYAIDPKHVQFLIKALFKVSREILPEELYTMWAQSVEEQLAVPTNPKLHQHLVNYNPVKETEFSVEEGTKDTEEGNANE